MKTRMSVLEIFDSPLYEWDTLAVGLDGQHCSRFVSPWGVRVEFFKNELRLFDTPTSMLPLHIRHGDALYRDVSVHAIQGPQSGIYAAVSTGYGETLRGMIGCGVFAVTIDDVASGSMLDGRWIGVSAYSIGWFAEQSVDTFGGITRDIDVSSLLARAHHFNQFEYYAPDLLPPPDERQ